MRAGRLNKRVTFQRRTLTQDASGATVPNYATFATVWAQVRTPGGFERLQPEIEAMRATLTHQVQVRAGSVTPRPSDRIVWGGRILEILSIADPDNHGAGYTLNCTEIVEPS